MTVAYQVTSVYPVITDIDGQPLEGGHVWIGQPDLDPQTNPIQVYWDKELTITAPQPIRTIGGYFARSGSPANIYAATDFSMRVMNKNGTIIYSAPRGSIAALEELAMTQLRGDLASTATDKGAALVAGVDVQIADYVALRAYTGTKARVYITGALGAAKPAGIAGVFQHDPTDTTSADNGGTIIVGSDGRRWKRDYSGGIYINWFGVNYNGEDAGPAFTNAAAVCNSFSPPADLIIAGKVTLITPALIDRQINGALTQSYFNVVGEGAKAGCHMVDEGFMFTTPPRTTPGEPVAQKVKFKNLTFSQDYWYGATYVLDDNKFISVDFVSCVFHKMRIAKTESYFQSISLIECSSYNTRGWLLESTGGAYDIRVSDCRFQAIEKIAGDAEAGAIKLQSVTGSHPVNFSFYGSHFQAINGVGLQADTVRAGLVSGCYFELNKVGDMKFDTSNNLANFAPNDSITLSGNFFSPNTPERADVNWFPVRWGRTRAAMAAGSSLYTDVNPGKLHHTIPETGYTFISEPGQLEGVSTSRVGRFANGRVEISEAVRTVTGAVSSAGVKTRGVGFDAAKVSAGHYYINLAPAGLIGAPAVVVTCENANAARSVDAQGVTSTSFEVKIFNPATGAAVDCGFNFSATGRSS